MFSCANGPKASELDVATGWGDLGSAKAMLEKHWDTRITEEDFAWLQKIGINTVRVPIGYWSLGVNYCLDTPFQNIAEVYEKSWSRVLRAISWASKYNIGVLIDLHGAPGSQNGETEYVGISHINQFQDNLMLGLAMEKSNYSETRRMSKRQLQPSLT
jgi:aryl-phospho-beta-D-glucosidase BglC (GH1 family)